MLDIDEVENVFQLRYGEPRAHDWPSDAVCEFDPEYPKDIALSDSPTGTGVILASARLQAALIELGVRNCEFLPLTIINHKGRVASREYAVIHPLEVRDCIDLKQSAAEFNDIDPDVLSACEQLVLKPEVIPDDLVLFRPRLWPKIALLRRAAAKSLRDAGFTGLHFIEPQLYTGLI